MSDIDAMRQVTAATSSEQLLSVLPQALLAAEEIDNDLTLVGGPSTTPSQSVGVAFYQGIAALIDGNFEAVACIRQQVKTIAAKAHDPLANAISLAFEQTYLANWDFRLSLGQTLHSKKQLEGGAILTGLLSASKVGMAGLPIGYYQSLMVPSPLLKKWLQQRWQMVSVSTVEQWSQEWWRQWSGCNIIAPASSTGATVCPVSYSEW